MYGYVYLTTNLINNKLYIGAHKSQCFDENYKGSGKFLKQAFKKYGWENFKCEILKECNSFEDLVCTEKLLIALYDAVKSKRFYNIKYGGEGWKVDSVSIKKGVKCSDQARKNISDAHKGKKWTDSQRESRKGMFVKENNPFYGKDFSPETKLLLSKIRRGRIWMNNGEKETQIPKNKFEEYSNQGYVRGRLTTSISNWQKAVVQIKYCWIRKDMINLRINLNDLDKYLLLGYQKGRYIPPRSATTIENIV